MLFNLCEPVSQSVSDVKAVRCGRIPYRRYAWASMERSRANALSRFQRLGRERQVLLVEAAATLIMTSAALRLLPFERVIRLGAIPLSGRPGSASSAEAVWAIESAGRRLPWRIVCIQKGIAAQRMLRRRGFDARLHYGIGRWAGEGELKAHVWVTLGGSAVIGGAEAATFAEVAAYP
jgi:hypothetical protein